MSGSHGDDGGADPPDPNPGPHVDAISEVEAEAEAQVPDLDLTHLPHDGADEPRPGAVRPGDVLLTGPAPNHHVGRQRFLVIYLRVALLLAFVAGVVELLLPEQHRNAGGTVMVAIFVIAPLGRIVWLMVRWLRRGDWRFALVGAVLLAVVGAGLVVR